MPVNAEIRQYPALKGPLRIDTGNARGELIGLRPRDIVRAYSQEKPQDMCLMQAPNAGEEGHRIWEKGLFTKEPTFVLDRPATVAEVRLPKGI